MGQAKIQKVREAAFLRLFFSLQKYDMSSLSLRRFELGHHCTPLKWLIPRRFAFSLFGIRYHEINSSMHSPAIVLGAITLVVTCVTFMITIAAILLSLLRNSRRSADYLEKIAKQGKSPAEY